MDIFIEFLKKWTILVIVLTIITVMIHIFLNLDFSESYKNKTFKSIEFINENTPSHPPPLLNFID